MTSRLVGALAFVLLGLALASARVPASAVRASLEGELGSAGASIARDGDARRLVDPLLGEALPLAPRPSRIVSLTLASDVMLASLVEVDRVVGVTALVDDGSRSRAAGHYPPSIARVRASAEALVALEPDLVIVSGYTSPETVRALVGAQVPVLRVPSGRSLDEVREALVLVAEAVGEPGAAASELRAFDERRAALVASRPEVDAPRALFLAFGTFTHGEGTLTDELMTLAGLDNLARARGLRGLSRVGTETLAAIGPDVIIVPADDEAEARASLAALGRPLAPILDRAQVIAIPPREIESTTPDCLDAAERLRRAISERSR